MTFDDRHFDDWTNAVPILAKYNAHVSFFPCGELSNDDLEKLRILHSAGHTIGSHTASHGSVPLKLERFFVPKLRFILSDIRPHEKALSSVGVELKSFAYPFGDHNDDSDAMLSSRFSHLRGADFRNYVTNGVSLASIDEAFVSKAALSKDAFVPGVLVGEYYETDIDDLCKALERCAARDEVLVLVSHGIAIDATDIDMKQSWLVALCEACRRGGVDMLGLDELSAPSCGEGTMLPAIFCAFVILSFLYVLRRKSITHG